MKKFFRRDNLLILVLAGILLFIIALPTKDSGGKGREAAEKKGVLGGSETAPGGGEESVSIQGAAQSDYAAELERRLTAALSEMAEVGKVRVMITLKSSEELVVEKEKPINSSMTEETDSQGGSRTVNTSEIGESVVYSKSDGSSSTPYVIKTYAPEIEGVLVVAEGAGSGTVNRTVTEIVQALFHVDAHKVKVVKMETKTR